MYNKFTALIKLGNDAMSTEADVARALRAIADKLDKYKTYGTVIDDNGNNVGGWEYSFYACEEEESE